jgi:hypothetical protein
MLAATVAGTAVAWWPSLLLGVPVWVTIGVSASFASLSLSTFAARSRRYTISPGVGTFLGLYCGSMIAGPEDPIAKPYVLYFAFVVGLVVVALAALGRVIIRRYLGTRDIRRTKIGALVYGLTLLGILSVAFAPLAVRYRIDGNERLAVARLTALSTAIQRSMDAYGVDRLSNSLALKPHYAGPPMGDATWHRMVANTAKQDGYWLTIRYEADRRFAISARPVREKIDGERHFCIDETGHMQCGVVWNGSRWVCTMCP